MYYPVELQTVNGVNGLAGHPVPSHAGILCRRAGESVIAQLLLVLVEIVMVQLEK